MLVQQYYVDGLAHLSYLLGGKTTCAIIDPKRDVEEYVTAAKKLGLKITHILETHLHADFVSGHMDLAKKTGATIYAPKAGLCAYGHVAVGDGDSFDIEDILDWQTSETTLRQEVIELAWQALPDKFGKRCKTEVVIDGPYINVTFSKEA